MKLWKGRLEVDLVDRNLHEKDSNIKMCGIWKAMYAFCDIIVLEFDLDALC